MISFLGTTEIQEVVRPCTWVWVSRPLIFLGKVQLKIWLRAARSSWSAGTCLILYNKLTLIQFECVIVRVSVLLQFDDLTLEICFLSGWKTLENNTLKQMKDTTGIFSYCWAVLAQCQGLLCFSGCPNRELARGVQGVGKGHSWDSWPQLTTSIFQTIWHCAQQIKLGGEGRKGRYLEWECSSSQVTSTCSEALLSWRWLNA